MTQFALDSHGMAASMTAFVHIMPVPKKYQHYASYDDGLHKDLMYQLSTWLGYKLDRYVVPTPNPAVFLEMYLCGASTFPYA